MPARTLPVRAMPLGPLGTQGRAAFSRSVPGRRLERVAAHEAAALSALIQVDAGESKQQYFPVEYFDDTRRVRNDCRCLRRCWLRGERGTRQHEAGVDIAFSTASTSVPLKIAGFLCCTFGQGSFAATSARSSVT